MMIKHTCIASVLAGLVLKRVAPDVMHRPTDCHVT